MKNLLISKSFSYEIVDSTLLRQTNTYHLGGGRSIHLSYGNVYKIVCDLRLLLLQKVSVVGSLRRRTLYPAELQKHDFLHTAYHRLREPLREVDASLQPDGSFESPSHLWLTVYIYYINRYVKCQLITANC